MAVAPVAVGNPIFDMEGDTNAYLLCDDAVVLIDAGVATAGTRAQLVDGLADRGVALADVDHLLVTHWHPDHAGLAGAVQAESDATVHAHAVDAPIVAGAAEARAELTARRRETLREWGLPGEARDRLADRLADGEGPRGYADDPPTVEPLADGERLSLGGLELTAVHAPGHTAGSTCYVLERDGRRAVFTGDALLPDYTANVGGADPRATHALSAHLETLEALADGDFDRGWPGHGGPMDEPGDRALTVLAHHRERAGRLLAAAREPATVWEAATELFGELASVHLMLGLGETHAHLEHLRRAQLVERTDEGYVTVAAHPGALDAAFPEVGA